MISTTVVNQIQNEWIIVFEIPPSATKPVSQNYASMRAHHSMRYNRGNTFRRFFSIPKNKTELFEQRCCPMKYFRCFVKGRSSTNDVFMNTILWTLLLTEKNALFHGFCTHIDGRRVWRKKTIFFHIWIYTVANGTNRIIISIYSAHKSSPFMTRSKATGRYVKNIIQYAKKRCAAIFVRSNSQVRVRISKSINQTKAKVALIIR